MRASRRPCGPVLALVLLLGGAAAAQQPAVTLEELLQQVEAGYRQESEQLTARLRVFEQQAERRAALLAEARAEVLRLEQSAEGLEREFDDNERLLAEAETTLRTRLGTMGELFGVIRQVAGDTRAQLQGSLISSQLRGRDAPLAQLADASTLPSITQIEKLWFLLHQEMTESGKVVRFPARVIGGDGQEQEARVVRVGSFNLLAGGRYLRWLPDVEQIAALARQPPARLLATVSELEQTPPDRLAQFAIDPSRGTILGLLVEAPSLEEHIAFGGLIGYATLGMGALAAFIGLLKLLALLLVDRKIRWQLRQPEPRRSNPLGRILLVHRANPGLDPESLERKMDEVVIRETARLDRWLWIIKVSAGAAPLMGLLGTVTGMIQTFQAITLFGTGDPRLMAGGISEALVTTELGLTVAIPLVLLYALLSSLASRLTSVLEEQTAGLVALSLEDAPPAPRGPAPPEPVGAATLAPAEAAHG
ncbi:MAG: MotA/TolQ/ExbB proton channel family protein [Myxococcota bacterium]|nr:MotA/TolQ/ExbB proton channel family protein [Myxococcota bacterium]